MTTPTDLDVYAAATYPNVIGHLHRNGMDTPTKDDNAKDAWWRRIQKYCGGVPPVLPVITPEAQAAVRGYLWGKYVGQERCIVCGRIHVTSEVCGREPPEVSPREGLYHNEAMKLEWARAHGMFDDV